MARTLPAVNGVRILRDGKSVHEVANPAPGSTVNFTPTAAWRPACTNIPYVQCRRLATDIPRRLEIYIGIDVPDAPRAVVLSEFEGKGSPRMGGSRRRYSRRLCGCGDAHIFHSARRRRDGIHRTEGNLFSEEIGDPGQQFDLSYAVVAINEKGTGPIAPSQTRFLWDVHTLFPSRNRLRMPSARITGESGIPRWARLCFLISSLPTVTAVLFFREWRQYR